MDEELSGSKKFSQPAIVPWWLFLLILVEGSCLYTWLCVTEPIIFFAHIGIAIPLALVMVKHESSRVKERRSSKPWSERIRTFPAWCVFAMRSMAVVAAFIIAVAGSLLLFR